MKHKKQKKMKKAGHILLAVFAVVIGTLGVLLFTSERWMRKTWPNLSMEELVYQLKAPIAGTSHDLLMSYVCSSALIAAAALILLILVSIFLREKRKAHVAFGMICIAAGAASIVYSINDVWAALDVKDYLKNQSTYNTVVEDNYVDPDRVNITFPEQKRNLIYLYLESMESTYADKSSGGAFDKNYIPELTQLAADNISFSNSELLGGGQPTVNATWTIAGIFAQTSGLPLSIGIQRNEMAYQASFFPEINTLGDVLADEGYKQYFFIGSIGQFGGREEYFKEHGDYEVDDYNWAMEKGLIPHGHRRGCDRSGAPRPSGDTSAADHPAEHEAGKSGGGAAGALRCHDAPEGEAEYDGHGVEAGEPREAVRGACGAAGGAAVVSDIEQCIRVSRLDFAGIFEKPVFRRAV